METGLVSLEAHVFKNIYIFAFSTKIKYIIQSASENRKQTRVQITRTNQCPKFSCYELYSGTLIVVLMFVRYFLAINNWSTICSMSKKHLFYIMTVGYSNDLFFIVETSFCKLFKAQNTPADARSLRWVPLNRRRPNAPPGVSCMSTACSDYVYCSSPFCFMKKLKQAIYLQF